jgi:cytochrome bd-type quinol oxidase subunit 2
MKKIFKQFIILSCLISVLILPYFVFATNDTLKKLDEVAAGEKGAFATGVDEFSMSILIGQVVSVFLGLLGIIFVVLMIYGGYNYMIARGEEEKVNKAIDTIRRAVVGLIIVMSSYAVWALIYNSFITAN